MSEITPKDAPKLPLKVLRWFCDPALLEDVEGDLMELYHSRKKPDSLRSKIRFTIDVFLLFRPGMIRRFQISNQLNSVAMVKNYIITAFRFALRYKSYTVINLLGLVVGLASTILILLWINDEINIDKFHTKADRIYRAYRNMHQSSGEVMTTPAIPQPLELVLENEYPEIDEVTLVGWEVESAFRFGDDVSYEMGRYTSPEFFSIFSFPFLAGDPETAMNDVSSVVITERLARKFFGDKWKEDQLALGNTFNIDNRKSFTITGVVKDPGPKSSIQFDWIIPADEYIQRNNWVESWYNGGFRMLFTLHEGADIAVVRERVEQEVNEHTNYEADERIYLQPFRDSYLNSNFENGVPSGGRIQYVRILLIVAVFILVIACINFMNLATARSNRRSKEIGIRKVMGAHRGGLRQQFFLESFLLTIASVIMAIGVVLITIPFFNGITGKTLHLDLRSIDVWIGVAGVTLVTGLFSGSYPALLLSSFKITNSLRGTIKHSRGGAYFRKGLVIFQFALSILLIIGTVIVYQQMQFVLNKNLGLDRENMVFVEMERDLARQREVYKTELQKIPEIVSVTNTSGNPLSHGRSTGGAEWEGKDPNENVEINVLNVDLDFMRTMRMEILQGRDFSVDFGSDTANYIINEVATDVMGFDDPINKRLKVWGQEGRIIGVVRNFHMDSMFEPIDPLIIRYDPNSTYVAFIKTQGNIVSALDGIEKVTRSLNPDYPFKYKFMDEEYERSYRNEMTLSTLINIFALVSIFISCLGLLGLSSYSTSQRSREIGIRKVHGASIANLVVLLSRDYAILMGLAFVIAAPLAYYVMREWLNDFAFRTELDLFIFAIAGIGVFVGGALTVGFKSYQAAMINPVNTLKDE